MKEINPDETTRAEEFRLWMNAPMPMVTLFKTLDVSNPVRFSKRKGLKFNMLMCWCSRNVQRDIQQSVHDMGQIQTASMETERILLRQWGEPAGSIGLLSGKGSHVAGIQPDEAKIGYWIGRPYWGQGLIPEAVRCLLHRCFTDLHISAVWGAYYDGNTKSRRVMDKCGFRFHHTKKCKTSPSGTAAPNIS